MDQNLKSQLIRSIFKFKSLIGAEFGMVSAETKSDVNMRELILMFVIADNSIDSANNIGLADIREYLSVSKGAVSQMLSSLEKKDFINRDIDKNNRRNLIVTLTPEGHDALTSQYTEFCGRLDKMISLLGEHDVKEMIRIVNRMIDITNEN